MVLIMALLNQQPNVTLSS